MNVWAWNALNFQFWHVNFFLNVNNKSCLNLIYDFNGESGHCFYHLLWQWALLEQSTKSTEELLIDAGQSDVLLRALTTVELEASAITGLSRVLMGSRNALGESLSDIQTFPLLSPFPVLFPGFSSLRQGSSPHHTRFQPCSPLCSSRKPSQPSSFPANYLWLFPSVALASMRAVFSVALRYRESSGHYLLGGPIF